MEADEGCADVGGGPVIDCATKVPGALAWHVSIQEEAFFSNYNVNLWNS